MNSCTFLPKSSLHRGGEGGDGGDGTGGGGGIHEGGRRIRIGCPGRDDALIRLGGMSGLFTVTPGPRLAASTLNLNTQTYHTKIEGTEPKVILK